MQRFYLESVFKSLNKFLLDSIQGEFLFTLDFFGLSAQQNCAFFGSVLKQTISLATETLKSCVNSSHDIYSVLLISLLNSRYKELNSEKPYSAVFDQYFEEVNIMIWPKFLQMFETHLGSLK